SLWIMPASLWRVWFPEVYSREYCIRCPPQIQMPSPPSVQSCATMSDWTADALYEYVSKSGWYEAVWNGKKTALWSTDVVGENVPKSELTIASRSIASAIAWRTQV